MDKNGSAKRCTIIGAGEFHILPGEERQICESGFIIAVDGGLKYCRRLGVWPDLAVGDFDSLEKAYLEDLAGLEERGRVVRLQPEKDDTDMLAAMKHGLQKGFGRFCVYAGCGGRLDHTLSNIQCLLYLKKRGAAGYLRDGESSVFVMKDESVTFPPGRQGYLSLFALGEKAEGVTIEGMKYPLCGYTVTNDFPIGVSNEFTGAFARVSVEKGELVVTLQNVIA